MSSDWYSEENLTHILNKIHLLVKEYADGGFITQAKLIEGHRLLSSNIYFLSVFLVEYQIRWNSVVYNATESTSNAAAKAEADVKFPELQTAKRIIETASRVCVSMSQELKIISNE